MTRNASLTYAETDHLSEHIAKSEGLNAPLPQFCNHENCLGCYTGYPQTYVHNWSHMQQVRSGIHETIHRLDPERASIIHKINVTMTHIEAFAIPDIPIVANDGQEAVIWDQIIHGKVGRDNIMK